MSLSLCNSGVELVVWGLRLLCLRDRTAVKTHGFAASVSSAMRTQIGTCALTILLSVAAAEALSYDGIVGQKIWDEVRNRFCGGRTPSPRCC